jgi:hypothetical protein
MGNSINPEVETPRRDTGENFALEPVHRTANSKIIKVIVDEQI